MARLSLKDKVESLDIQRELEEKPLLLRLERSQLMWFVHLISIPPGHLIMKVFQELGLVVGSECNGEIIYVYIYICGLGMPWDPAEAGVAEESDIWTGLMNLLPP